jgi:hypothetical protein
LPTLSITWFTGSLIVTPSISSAPKLGITKLHVQASGGPFDVSIPLIEGVEIKPNKFQLCNNISIEIDIIPSSHAPERFTLSFYSSSQLISSTLDIAVLDQGIKLQINTENY